MIALKEILHSVIMADFIMLETQQPIIVIILIIYSLYLLKDDVELQEYIPGRIVSQQFQFLHKLQAAFFSLMVCRARSRVLVLLCNHRDRPTGYKLFYICFHVNCRLIKKTLIISLLNTLWLFHIVILIFLGHLTCL